MSLALKGLSDILDPENPETLSIHFRMKYGLSGCEKLGELISKSYNMDWGIDKGLYRDWEIPLSVKFHDFWTVKGLKRECCFLSSVLVFLQFLLSTTHHPILVALAIFQKNCV